MFFLFHLFKYQSLELKKKTSHMDGSFYFPQNIGLGWEINFNYTHLTNGLKHQLTDLEINIVPLPSFTEKVYLTSYRD